MSRTILIQAPASIAGTISLPGDKSISHRAALLASVAAGTSIIDGFASSADCRSTLECIRRVGIDIEHEPDRVVIHGKGLRGYSVAAGEVELDAGNSGSTIRMMSGLLAAQPFRSLIVGDASLSRRPMKRIIEPLRLMGCRIEAREGSFPPLSIRGGPLKAIDYTSRVASAQVKTCVLFAALLANGRTTFREPEQSRDHTEHMLTEFGARFGRVDDEAGILLAVEGGAEISPVIYRVPGDLSSAAFFVAAASLVQDSDLILRDVSLNPSRTAFLEVLARLGAKIERENVRVLHGEPVGDLRVTGSRLRSDPGGLILSGAVIANIVDELPILAIVATQVEGRVEVRGARELRLKESDRIRSIVAGLRAIGGEVEEYDDGFSIRGPQRLTGGRVDSFGDHRIAMAFTIAGLVAEGEAMIADADCAAVSFPEFYDLVSRVAVRGSVRSL